MSTSTAEVASIHGLTLETLQDGAAVKLFDEQLQAVAANILDERTEPKTKRAVVLTVEFQPFVDDETAEVDRESVAVNMKAMAKLAPIQTGELQHRLRRRGDRHQIVLGL